VLILNGDQNKDSLSIDNIDDENSREKKKGGVVMNNVCFPSQV